MIYVVRGIKNGQVEQMNFTDNELAVVYANRLLKRDGYKNVTVTIEEEREVK